MRQFGKQKRLNKIFCAMATVLVLFGAMVSPFTALSAHADGYIDDVVDVPVYSLSVSYSSATSGSGYYDFTSFSVSANAPVFLVGKLPDSDPPEYKNLFTVCIYDFSTEKVYKINDPKIFHLNPVCTGYQSSRFNKSDNSLVTSTFDETGVNTSLGTIQYFNIYRGYDDDLNFYLCNGYVFDTSESARLYFLYGDDSGLLQEPVVPDPDDPTLDPDYDPDSIWGKIIESIRSIFKDWSFTKFLNLFSSNIFKDWSFTKFLNLFSTNIFKDWSFDKFLDMIKTAMFGTQTYKNIYDFFEEKTDGWDFNKILSMISEGMFGTGKIKNIYDFFEEKTDGWDFNKILSMIREGMFGSQKFKDIYDFFEEKTDGWDFNKILSMISEGMFGTGKVMTLYDFFSQLFDDLGLSTIAEDIKEMVRVALVGDPEHSLWGVLFVPDEEVLEENLSEFLDIVYEKFPGIMKLIELGEQVVDAVKVASGSKAPSFTIELGKSSSYDLGNATITIDFSWYAPYKPTVDLLLAGIIWVGFIWRMYSRIPEIIGGVGMAVSLPYKIEHYEIQNVRLEESRRRSDIRWEAFQESQSRRRRK